MQKDDVVDVTVVIDTDKDLKKLYNMETKISPYLTIYDFRFLSDRKSCRALKTDYGSIENPFIEVKVNGEFAKVFYKEASEDPIQDLINYLNE